MNINGVFIYDKDNKTKPNDIHKFFVLFEDEKIIKVFSNAGNLIFEKK